MAISWIIPSLICVVFLSGRCYGQFDLYMNSLETRRLIGVEGELYYVRNGIINNYALSFTIPLNRYVNYIAFTWQNLRKTAMYYNMAITVSDPQAMATPQTNISADGQVPFRPTAFVVQLQCTRLRSAEVDIRIQLNVSIFSTQNQTVLNIKRKKTCLKDDFQKYGGDHNHRGPPGGNNNGVGGNVPGVGGRHNLSFVYPDGDRSGDVDESRYISTSTYVFYIAIGCACGVIFLVAFSVAMYYMRSKKPSNNDRLSSNTESAQGLTQHQTFLRPDTPNNSVTGLSNVRRPFTPVNELKPCDIALLLQEVQLERSRISLGDILMEGTFGRIYHATLLGEDQNDIEEETEVYVKTVTDQARLDQVETMLREACMLKGQWHTNINPLLAACMDDPHRPLLVFAHTDQGNLKRFLQRCKISDVASSQTLSTQQLVYLAIQVCRGVQHLHRRRMIHKDLATRNCVVDSALTVRLTDTALSRDLFPNEYHCLGDNENRPVKWLSLEALLGGQFSYASDVWAFGVTLWELMMLGQQPYADIDPFEMATYLKEGYRIAQPFNCPDELFAVIACCWAASPEERPKISQLLICLQDFYNALGKFV